MIAHFFHSLHKMRDGDQSESVDTKYAFNEHGTTLVWQCN